MQVKILLVDDSASNSSNMKNILGEYCVFTALNGLEAMRILEEQDGINLILIGLNEPDMKGLQFLEYIKGDKRFRKLRTIVLTNSDELDNEIRSLQLGVADYIRKPIHRYFLKNRIDMHVALLRAEQLIEQKLNFDIVFNQAPIGIAIYPQCNSNDSDELPIKINTVFEQITGRSKEDLIRLGWESITHPDDLKEDLENYRRLQSGEIKSYSMEKRYIKPDGSVVWVHMIVAPLTLSDDQQYGHICLVQDISKRKASEIALNESERSKSVFLSHLPGLAYRCNFDYDWTMQYVSKGCLKLTGYPPESLLYNRDLSYNDLISPEYREVLRDEWDRVIAKRQPFKYEYEIITATGQRKWVLEMGQAIYKDDGEVEALEGLVLDISDRKAIEDTLKYNNEHDRLTGLYNRDYLVSLLEKDLKFKKDSKKALIGINLSMVQLVTINYGYQYSQNLIKKAAQALNRYCTHNRLLFQPRENRFIFYIFDYKDTKELVNFSHTIINTLESLLVTERIGGGIGILEIEQGQNEADIELLLRKLLIASEKSVNMFGRDFEICFYDEGLEALVNRERDIVAALNLIAEEDYTNNNLFLQYQPIVDAKTGSTFSFEALARLRTEKLGLVSPAEFIPIAEKTKLILPVGEKVLAKAFGFLNKLKAEGYNNVGVAVNISVIQLLQPDFADKLFKLMSEMQINPEDICIEITESVFASDFEKINNTLDKLKNSGFNLAIDDFGVGYSSLSRENELIVDCVKIDKYFIDKLLHTQMKQAITSEIISMIHKLGHCTIAEGVEHKSQLQYLKEHDCDWIQGYLISKPLDEEDAIKFLKTGANMT
jgi:PAS domain S-box-containing protein